MNDELGTVTLLMVDQVGSTDQLGVLGDNLGRSVRSQLLDGLLRVVTDHRGTLVDTAGDGLLAHFPGAALGLDAARACMDLVTINNRRVGEEERCQLRAGVHTGDPLVDGAGRLHGMAVVVAARLCGAAGVGQVLASDLNRALVASRTEFTFGPPMQLELKGLPAPVTAFALQWEPPNEEMSSTDIAAVSIDERFPFCGRSQEMHALTEALEAALGGRRQVVALSGEPGVGKTRLAAELLRTTAHRGGSVAIGVCDEDVQGPYQPMVDALTGLFAAASGELVNRLRDRHPAVSGLLLTGGEAAEAARMAPVERHQLFSDAVAVIRAFCTDRPVCLLLDDVQWATPDTLAMIRHLVRNTANERLLVLMTYRDVDVSQEHPLFPLLADLHRVPGTLQMKVQGLSADDVVQLATAAAGHDLGPGEAALARRIHEECGGSPFFVTEMILNLVQSGSLVYADGRWALGSDDVSENLPVSVRDVVLRRVGRLGAETQQFLTLAAVVGYAFELEVLVKVAGIDEDNALGFVESAIDANLVEEVGPDRFRFRHRLTRDSLYRRLSATRRARLHRRIAEAIEALPLADHVDDLAYHWSEATGLSDAARVARYCQLAGDRAVSRRAVEDARRYYRRAVTALEMASGVDDATWCDLLLSLGRVERDLGDGAARTTLREAVSVARRIGDHKRLARAVLIILRAGAFCTNVGREDAELIALIDEVLPHAQGGDRARLLAARAAERHWSTPALQLAVESDEALQLARSNGDPRLLAEVLLARCFALAGPDHTAERPGWAREAGELARQLGSLELQAMAGVAEITARYELGDVTCLAELADLRALGEQDTNGFTRWVIAMLEAMRAIAVDPVRGEEAAMEAYRVGESTSQPEVLEVLSVQLAEVLGHSGRSSDIVSLYRDSVQAKPGLPSLRAGFAKVLVDVGLRDEAARELDLVVGSGLDSPRDMAWLSMVTDAAYVAAQVGTRNQQERLYQLLEPFADRQATAVWFLITTGSVRRSLGLLSEAMGDRKLAIEHLRAALDQDLRFGHDVLVAATAAHLTRLGAPATQP